MYDPDSLYRLIDTYFRQRLTPEEIRTYTRLDHSPTNPSYPTGTDTNYPTGTDDTDGIPHTEATNVTSPNFEAPPTPASLAIALGFTTVPRMLDATTDERYPEESRELLQFALTQLEATLSEDALMDKINVSFTKFMMDARMNIVPQSTKGASNHESIQINILGISSTIDTQLPLPSTSPSQEASASLPSPEEIIVDVEGVPTPTNSHAHSHARAHSHAHTSLEDLI